MPPGCRGFVYATVSHRLTQLCPFNSDGQIRTNAETVMSRYYWELKEPQPELILKGWAPSAAFDHVVAVRVEILPQRVASMIPVVELLTRLLSRMGVFG